MASPADQPGFREHSFIEQAREQVQQLFKPRPPPWAAAEAHGNGDNVGGMDHAALSPSASLEVGFASPYTDDVDSNHLVGSCTAGDEIWNEHRGMPISRSHGCKLGTDLRPRQRVRSGWTVTITTDLCQCLVTCGHALGGWWRDIRAPINSIASSFC